MGPVGILTRASLAVVLIFGQQSLVRGAGRRRFRAAAMMVALLASVTVLLAIGPSAASASTTPHAVVAAETGADDLAQLARRIKNVGDVHPAQLSQQVVAVGADANGTLVAASNTSSSFTAGQRALMDELGVLRAPSRTVAGDALHAEQNLIGAFPEPVAVGLSALEPCATRCGPLLAQFDIPWAVAK